VLKAIRRYRGIYVPAVGDVAFGDFGRTRPIGDHFGYGRGTPVDRIYMERFLARNAALIRGRTLEVVDDGYTRRFGAPDTVREVVDFRAENPKATIVGDLTNLGPEWAGAFDAIVVTQTLQLIFDVRGAIRSLHGSLKPGGTVLATVPGITSIDPSEAKTWFWAFTEASMHRLFAEVFGAENVAVEVFGNVGTAVSFLQGLAAEELDDAMFDVSDARYPVIIAVRATRG